MFYGHLVTFTFLSVSQDTWPDIKGYPVIRFLESRHSGTRPGALIKLIKICPFEITIYGTYDH